VFRIINMLTIAGSILYTALVSVKRRDRVLVVTNPPVLPFIAAAVSWLKGARLLLLVHDVYPDALIAAGVVRRGTRIDGLLQWISRRLYRFALWVIVLGRDMKQLVERRMQVEPERVILIPNWADADVILPRSRDQNALLAELGLDKKFVVQYAGNMGYTHGLDCLVRAMDELKDEVDVHFMFVGSGTKKRWLEVAAEQLGLTNLTVLGSRPRSDQGNFLNACDIAIISFAPGMAGVSVPSRMYNVLAAGKPIIAVADPWSELGLVVSEEAVGWVVPPGDAGGVARAVREASTNSDKLRRMGLRARRVAERYCRERTLDAYRSLLGDA
jgi:glycosyltransferase involved in cell wall biosynthesis